MTERPGWSTIRDKGRQLLLRSIRFLGRPRTNRTKSEGSDSSDNFIEKENTASDPEGRKTGKRRKTSSDRNRSPSLTSHSSYSPHSPPRYLQSVNSLNRIGSVEWVEERQAAGLTRPAPPTPPNWGSKVEQSDHKDPVTWGQFATGEDENTQGSPPQASPITDPHDIGLDSFSSSDSFEFIKRL